MQRLLNKAEEISGYRFDISSYADIVAAIHVVQEEMGITGTTAKEADKTIQGSMQAVKAAWSNLVTEFGKGNGDLSTKISELVTSVETYIGNVVPVAKQALIGIANFVREMGPIIVQKLPELVRDILPSFHEAAWALVTEIVKVLPSMLQAIIDVIGVTVDSISAYLNEKAPAIGAIFDTVINGIKKAWNGVHTFLTETFIPALDKFRTETLGKIVTFVTTIFADAWEGIKTFWNGPLKDAITAIQTAFNTLWNNYLKDIATYVSGTFKTAWKKITDFFNNNAGKAVSSIITFFKQLWEEVLVPFGNFLVEVFQVHWEGLRQLWEGPIQTILNTLKDIFTTLWKDVLKPLGTFLTNTFKKAWEGIKDFFNGDGTTSVSDITELYRKLWKDIIVPLATFVANTFKAAWEKIKDFFNGPGGDAIKAIKDVFSTLYNDIIMPLAEFLKTTFLTAWEGIKTFYNETLSPAVENIKTAFNTLKTASLEKIAGYVVGGFKTAFTKIKDFFNIDFGNAINSIKDKFLFFLNWVISPIANFLNFTLFPAFSGIKDLFFGALGNAINWVKDRFSDFKTTLSDIWEYIKYYLSPIFDALGNVIDFLKNWILIPVTNFLNGSFASALGNIAGWVGGAIQHISNLLGWVRGAMTEIGNLIGKAAEVGYNNLFPGGNPASGYFVSSGLGFAEGGTLRSGSVWVGEEAPEILTVKNGVATVTPVSGSGRHSPVGSNSFTFNIYAQHGQDEEAIARAVQKQFVRWEKQKGAAYVG